MNQQLIEQLRNGEIAVKNDGTMEQLLEVLKKAFPNEGNPITGIRTYYFALGASYCTGDYTTNKPAVSVAEFFKEEDFKWGEEVEVSDDGEEWYPAVYGCKVPESHINFKNGYHHTTFTRTVGIWKLCRRTQVRKITLAEVAEKFGTTPDKIKIV